MIKISKILEEKVIGEYGNKMTLELEGGQTVDYWGSGLVEGQELEGTIVPNKNPKYNDTLKITKTSQKPNFGSKTQDIQKAMKAKEVGIQVAQERKNGSIEEAANWRDAVMIVNTLLANKVLVDGIDLLNHNELERLVKNSIINWKNWFSDMKNPQGEPPF